MEKNVYGSVLKISSNKRLRFRINSTDEISMLRKTKVESESFMDRTKKRGILLGPEYQNGSIRRSRETRWHGEILLLRDQSSGPVATSTSIQLGDHTLGICGSSTCSWSRLRTWGSTWKVGTCSTWRMGSCSMRDTRGSAIVGNYIPLHCLRSSPPSRVIANDPFAMLKPYRPCLPPLHQLSHLSHAA